MRYLIVFLMLCGCCFGQVEFGDNNDYLWFPYESFWNLGTNDFTISAWITHYSLTNRYQTLIGNYYGFTGNSKWLIQSDFVAGTYKWVFFNGASTKSDALDLSIGQVYHFALVRENLSSEFFVNGISSGTGTISVVSDSINAFFVSAPTCPIKGNLEDVRMYTRSLSSAEINEICLMPWSLTEDPYLVLRTCITTNDTGNILSDPVRNYGSGSDGTIKYTPIAASRKIRIRKPMGMIP